MFDMTEEVVLVFFIFLLLSSPSDATSAPDEFICHVLKVPVYKLLT